MFCHLTKRVKNNCGNIDFVKNAMPGGRIFKKYMIPKNMNFKAGNSDPSCRESDKMKKDALQDAGQSHESGHRISKGFLQD